MAKSSDIRQKEVIDVTEGIRLGYIADMEFSGEGHIRAFTVPGPFSVSSILRGDRNGLTIDWDHVVMIGEDVSLVRMPEGMRRTNLRKT